MCRQHGKHIGNIMSSTSKFKRIVKEVASIALSYGIKNSYVVGGYPRSIIMGTTKDDVHDLDFASAWPGEATKLGTLVASELVGDLPEIYHRTGTIKFTYEDVDLEFQGTLGSVAETQPIMSELIKYGIAVSPLTLNIYARDFTINTLIQDLNNLQIYDITGFGVIDIENGLIRSAINPSVMAKINTLIILRAIRFSLRYNFRIVDSLSETIDQYKHLLLKKYTPERLQIEVLKMLQENYEGTLYMLKKYRLEQVLENKSYNIFDILDRIDITTFDGDLKSLVTGDFKS